MSGLRMTTSNVAARTRFCSSGATGAASADWPETTAKKLNIVNNKVDRWRMRICGRVIVDPQPGGSIDIGG
jgi:hypothetical protein